MADKLDMFQLLGVPRKFRVDQKALDEGYRRVELQVHPDRFASATPAMKRVAEQWSQRANKALSTLSDPLKRAVYLCESAGFPVNAENNTRMPVDFLMQQMEWREKFEAGKNSPEALAKLASVVQEEKTALVDRLAALLDDEQSPEKAVPEVRRLMFVDKMARDIAAAIHQ